MKQGGNKLRHYPITKPCMMLAAPRTLAHAQNKAQQGPDWNVLMAMTCQCPDAAPSIEKH